MVTASTIYMAIMGPDGLERTALASHQNTRELVEKLAKLDCVEAVFDRPFFHEKVIKVKGDAKALLEKLAQQNIVGGFALEDDYPELENAIVVCATETKTSADIDIFVDAVKANV